MQPVHLGLEYIELLCSEKKHLYNLSLIFWELPLAVCAIYHVVGLDPTAEFPTTELHLLAVAINN